MIKTELVKKSFFDKVSFSLFCFQQTLYNTRMEKGFVRQMLGSSKFLLFIQWEIYSILIGSFAIKCQLGQSLQLFPNTYLLCYFEQQITKYIIDLIYYNQMLSQVSINGKKMFLIGLGYQHHFKLLMDQKGKYVKQNAFWCYDKSKLDIAYQLNTRIISGQYPQQRFAITYITKHNFQTVYLKKKLNYQKKQEKILDLILNYDYRIKRIFIDLHPYEAYTKMCKFMASRVQLNQMSKIFTKPSFSTYELELLKPYLPYLIQKRKQYLDNSGLKLRYLQRLKTASQSQLAQAIQYWRQHFQINKLMTNNLTHHTLKDEEIKNQWIVKNKFGWEISKSDFLNGLGHNYSYGIIDSSNIINGV